MTPTPRAPRAALASQLGPVCQIIERDRVTCCLGLAARASLSDYREGPRDVLPWLGYSRTVASGLDFREATTFVDSRL